MKTHIAQILTLALLPMACGQATEAVNAAKQTYASISSEDQAANELYLDDAIDSAADENSPTDVDSDVEAEVKDDLTSMRLAQMTAELLKRLDADASGSLSLDEFLIGPAKRTEEKSMNDIAARIKAKLTEEFHKFAGDDELLSSSEITELLKSAAARIGHHRRGNCPGQRTVRVQQSARELIGAFDKDGDGKLNAAEIEAMQTAKKAEMDEFRNSMGEGKGHTQGQGPDAPMGDGPAHVLIGGRP
jgi:hypothetical protein